MEKKKGLFLLKEKTDERDRAEKQRCEQDTAHKVRQCLNDPSETRGPKQS